MPMVHARIDLGLLAEYYRLKPQVAVARNRYFKVHRQVLAVVNELYASYKEAETVVRLRREIRLATKGTPVTIEQNSISAAGYVSMGTEQLYNAESHLVTGAYKKLVTLVHPDREGGDLELFQLVNAAYHLKDLTYLQELYISLTKDSVAYRASTEGLAYLRQEIERPQVSLRLLQSTPEFKIARQYLGGHKLLARQQAHMRIKELVVVLGRELTYITTKHINPSSAGASNGNETQEGTDQVSESESRSSGEESDQEGFDIHGNWDTGKGQSREGQVPGEERVPRQEGRGTQGPGTETASDV